MKTKDREWGDGDSRDRMRGHGRSYIRLLGVTCGLFGVSADMPRGHRASTVGHQTETRVSWNPCRGNLTSTRPLEGIDVPTVFVENRSNSMMAILVAYSSRPSGVRMIASLRANGTFYIKSNQKEMPNF